MTTPPVRARAFRPSVRALEGRLLLTGPSASWIGQDGHDFVGQSYALGGNGVQDMHFRLSDLPADKSVAFIDVKGLGGGDWQYQGPPGTWAAALFPDASASGSADLYVDPYQYETGRPFQLDLRYSDGSTETVWATGGQADPNLRMPGSTPDLSWVGQDGADRVGPGPSPGPDGAQDLHLTLSNLPPAETIQDVILASSDGLMWASGINPSGLNRIEVERSPSDPTKAELYLSPTEDLNGRVLTATIDYASGKSDTAVVVASSTDPSLAAAPTAPAAPTFLSGLSASWIGQDGQDLAGPGSARISLSGLPAGRTVIAAAVSDESRGLFVYRSGAGAGVYSDSWTEPLAFRPTASGADVAFAPDRNESGATLTVRLTFDDGSMAFAQLVGGSTDVTLRAGRPAASSIVAHPGDDLNALANTYGTVRLTAGTYDLAGPLILNNPVSILADPGVAVRFSQADADPAWSTAIKIHAGNTTLSGFAVRFATPIRWADGVNYGPAVIGTTDNLDTGPSPLKAGIVLTGLDLESPPVPASTVQVEAPRLIRLTTGLSGTVTGNTLKGGTTEVFGGPWTITNNRYLGTVPGTFAWAAFAGHSTHDFTLSGNTAQPTADSGRTWRFLVLTAVGTGDVVANNTVVGIGPRDGDTVDMNAAEIILTESYSLKFEGMPTSVSSDGRILRIPTPQGGPAETGDVVAILSGPFAGQYRRIAQALGPQTYLVADPLPSGSYDISIGPGFVGEKFTGNTVDARGGAGAGDMVFVGNHYGTTIADNHLLGGAQALLVTAAPTEHPGPWGWSHAPFLGATITGNVFEDSGRAAMLAVEHSSAIQSDAGRAYFSASLTSNTVMWTAPFLAARGANTPDGIVVGQGGSLDPGELLLTASRNAASAPGGGPQPTLRIVSGMVNGQAVRDQSWALSTSAPGGVTGGTRSSPPLVAPPGLALVNDTGLSNRDLETMDGRVTFGAVPGAVGYEYWVSLMPGYLPLASAGPFLPALLVQGSNTINVRAIDAQGNRGPISSFQIYLDNSPPRDSIPFLRPWDDTGTSATDHLTKINTPTFNVVGDPTDTMILYRNGVEIGRSINTSAITEPAPLPDGVYNYWLVRYDAAGNRSVSPPVAITIDTTPPSAVPNVAITATGIVTFGTTAPGDQYQYRIGTSGLFSSLGSLTGVQVPAGSVVTVRAVDAAGNPGPETVVQWTAGGSAPVASGPSSAPTTAPAATTSPVAGAPAATSGAGLKRRRMRRIAKAKAHVVAEAHPKGPRHRVKHAIAKKH